MKRINQILAVSVIASVAAFTACKTGSKRETASTKVTQGSSDLTWKDAQERKARVSNVHYTVAVNLTDPGATFTGTAELRFDLTDNKKPLRVDFYEGKIASLKVNGQVADASAKKTYWIDLPAALLKAGPNIVTLEYTQEYSRQGQGLHKFTDPQTKEVFLYTQFETFDANRFMPCFDQPDLRAPLVLTVEAPASWEVITATMESKVEKPAKGVKRWHFPVTPSISTYLYSLHAGPYKIWKDKYEDIPLRLFARPSMAKYVRVKEWFTYTKQGLKFFNAYFDFTYPFKKYDQLVVPEFNAGAMENVAAVTFNENFLWRSQPTRPQLRGLASVILHEMAHMWFGDIVTMKWWNDLWLNESFATFMATLALAEATEFKEAWQDFFASEKNWAYWEDSLITTHPIEGQVNSVKVAFATFDGITYGKGAAVLKQLNTYITPEAFKKGIQNYIKTYAYQNAELKEFIGSLQGQTQRDLALWSARTLRQSGTDKIAAKWTCTGATLTQIDLVVTPTTGREFRPQTVKLALFQEKNGALSDGQSVRVDLNGPNESVKGSWPCPAFVYPNYQDEGYIAVSLDPKSLDYARKNLSKIKDGLLRTMVWDDVWEMVRNTEMPLRDYIQIVNVHFPKETDQIILEQIVSTISSRQNASILNYWPQTDERLQRERMEFIAGMEKEYLRRFQTAKAGTDDQRLWFDNYVGLARTSKALDQLATWAGMPNVAKGMPLDVDRNWAVVRTLARYQHPKAIELLGAIRIKDSSDRGQRYALSTEAIQPDLKVKEKWIGILAQPKPSVTFAEARSVTNALFPVEQRSLAKRFEKDFYEYLKANARSENEIFVEIVAESMAPLNCSAEESGRLRKFLKDSDKWSPTVAKSLKVSLDEDERCQRIRALSSL